MRKLTNKCVNSRDKKGLCKKGNSNKPHSEAREKNRTFNTNPHFHEYAAASSLLKNEKQRKEYWATQYDSSQIKHGNSQSKYKINTR